MSKVGLNIRLQQVRYNLSTIFSRNISSLKKKNDGYHSSSTIGRHFLSWTVFSSIALDGRLIDVTTMGGSRWDAKRWPRPLAERWPLNRGLSFILFYNYFGGLITGRLPEGGRLMKV